MRKGDSHRDWIVWSRERPMKGDGTLRGFEHVGKAIFCGQVKRSKKEHEAPEAEDEAETTLQTMKVVGADARAGRKDGGSVGM